MTQYNLGNALKALAEQSKAVWAQTYFDRAIECYDNALSVYDAKNFPRHHRILKGNKERALKAKTTLLKSEQQGAPTP